MSYASIDKYVENMKQYHFQWRNYYRKKHEPYNPDGCQDINIFKRWCEKYNITEYRQGGIKSWVKLDSKKRGRISVSRTPLEDHASIFRTADKKLIFITQPYASIKAVEDNNIFQWAKERGLKLEAFEELSWHYAGSTILLQYSIEDKGIFDNYINEHRVRTRYY